VRYAARTPATSAACAYACAHTQRPSVAWCPCSRVNTQPSTTPTSPALAAVPKPLRRTWRQNPPRKQARRSMGRSCAQQTQVCIRHGLPSSSRVRADPGSSRRMDAGESRRLHAPLSPPPPRRHRTQPRRRSKRGSRCRRTLLQITAYFPCLLPAPRLSTWSLPRPPPLQPPLPQLAGITAIGALRQRRPRLRRGGSSCVRSGRRGCRRSCAVRRTATRQGRRLARLT
jgi:hypothetical protein